MILPIHNSTTRDDQTLDESPGSLQNRNVFLIADHDADHRKAQQLSCDLGLPLTMISEGELSDSDSDLDKYPKASAPLPKALAPPPKTPIQFFIFISPLKDFNWNTKT